MVHWFKRFSVVVLLLVLLLALGTAQAQDTPAISPALETQLATLVDVTVGIRELPTLREVEFVFPSRDDLRDYLAHVMEEEYTSENVAKMMAFYTAFDFLTPETDLRAVVDELYNAQIAGFYDTDTQDMNVILMTGDQPADKLPLLDQITFVHEYTHALQDQHFDLDAYLERMEEIDNDDMLLAMLALVEGDATLVMYVYTERAAEANPLGALGEILSSGLQAGNLFLPPSTPRIIGAELLFPYEVGQSFVQAVFLDGGWAAVNAAYDNPPASTEQVIHPEKYLAGEMPIEVTLADIAESIEGDWTLARAGTMGEFYLRRYLNTQIDVVEARQAAAGWGGDRYHIYQSADGQQAWVLQLMWDSPADATEFQTAYEAFLAKRFEDGSVNGGCYVGAIDTICATFTDTGTALTGAPTRTLAQQIQQLQIFGLF